MQINETTAKIKSRHPQLKLHITKLNMPVGGGAERMKSTRKKKDREKVAIGGWKRRWSDLPHHMAIPWAREFPLQ